MSIRGRSHDTERDRERGAALVEMALVTPLLILLLFGIWTVARAYNVKNTMDHAVREAARFGATLDPWDAALVDDLLDAELSASAVSPALVVNRCIEIADEGTSECGSATAPADQVVVSIEYPGYELSFVFFSLDVDIASYAAARYES